MTLKQFLQDNTATAFETVGDTLFNVVVGEGLYGVKSDTTNIPTGTLLERFTEFVLTDTTLQVGQVLVNLEEVDMLYDPQDHPFA